MMAGTEAQVLEMDRNELIRILKERGVERVHYFADGRKALIRRKRPRPNVEVFIMSVENMLTSFSWSDGIGYYSLEECESVARQMFGISEWNTV